MVRLYIILYALKKWVIYYACFRPSSEWIWCKEAVFSPGIITREDWEAVQCKMLEERRGPRAGKNPEMVLSGLVYCSTCGQRMSASTIRQKARRVRLVYLCSTYLTYHGPDNPTNCKSHSIKQDLLLKLIQEWMLETGRTLSQIDSEQNLLVALYRDRNTASDGLRQARQALEAWMAEALEMVCEGEPTPDGRTRYCLGDWDFCLPNAELVPVWECYQWLVSAMGKQNRDQEMALEAQHDRLCHALMLAPTELTRDKIAGEVARVEGELSSLRVQPGGRLMRSWA